MLKKIKYIVLVVLLVASTVGAAISKHYCGDHIVSISFLSSAAPCCDDTDSDCCHNEDEFHILRVDYCVPNTFIASIYEFTINLIGFNEPIILSIENNINNHIELNGKPPLEIQVFLAKYQSYLL